MRKILFILLAVSSFSIGVLFGIYKMEPTTDASGRVAPAPAAISAEAAVLVDESTGRVLWERNSGKKCYPASTTKIMTALVTLDICRQRNIDLKQEIYVPTDCVGMEGSSLYLKSRQKISIERLLYGIMLRSGNDGATALAETLGGTLKDFVRMMNEKAETLKCKGTQFVNACGLFDDNHYTTARDLAVITRAAMKYSSFREIVGTKQWEDFKNKNKTLFQYRGGTGVKTGFTKRSGRTLVTSATRGKNRLICVVLNDGNWFNDAYCLMDYGFRLMGEI